MSDPGIEVRGLTKRFGAVTAVSDLSFSADAGLVTGFLGPNGAGKTTTLRMILGLVRPSSGTALINGERYSDIPHPATVVGAVLESSGFHPARTARDHLSILATTAGLPRRRVEETLGFVGLADVADRRVGGYSMGMRQRLEFARALLGRPQILLLDEPANGLDPAGIAWLRHTIRSFAAEGGVVLISSHLLAEAAQTVDNLVVLRQGRLAGQGPMQRLLEGATHPVRVRSTDPTRLADALARAGLPARREGADSVVVDGASPEQVGRVMADAGVVVLEMASSGESLEDLFFSMTTEAAA